MAQRPENVVAGHMKWSNYRAPGAPSTIKVVRHKTGTIAAHPLDLCFGVEVDNAVLGDFLWTPSFPCFAHGAGSI